MSINYYACITKNLDKKKKKGKGKYIHLTALNTDIHRSYRQKTGKTSNKK